MYCCLDTIPPKEWPHLGEIIFKKINLRYNSNGLYILKNLNFRIQPMEKVLLIFYFSSNTLVPVSN